MTRQQTAHRTGHGDVELVVVAYRSRAEVEELVAGLPADLSLALVDNFDDGDGLARVMLDRPNARYLTGGGVGYSRAANLAARSSRAEYLVFVTPDLRPRLRDIERLVEDVAADPLCAASAGVLVDPDGRPEWSAGGWEPTLARSLVHAAGLHRLLPRRGIYCRPETGREIDVDWVSGGCMAVRRWTFLELGCFDEDFYVYNEDMAFGRQSRDRGLHQRLRTDVTIRGSSGSSGAPSLEMGRLHGTSMAGYLRKYRPGPAAEVSIIAFAIGRVVRALVRLLAGDSTRARSEWANAAGLLTGRATVGGRPVVHGHRSKVDR